MRAARVLICLFITLVAVNAFAALPMRTWVASNGDDTGPCALHLPCKTLQVAYGKTEVGGMISIKDSNAVGTLFINKSITVDGSAAVGSVLFASGDGITINFTSNDGLGNKVVLRGLSLYSSYGGGYGVTIAGTVPTHVDIVDTVFTRMAAAVGMVPGAAGSSLRMENCEGSNLTGYGVLVSGPAGTATKLTMNNVRMGDAGTTGTYQAGLRLAGNTNGTISDSKFQNGYQGVLIDSPTVHVSLVRTVMSENVGSGLHHSAAGITTILDGCSIMGNNVGVSNAGSTIIGFGNNSIAYNAQDVAGNMIQTIQQQ